MTQRSKKHHDVPKWLLENFCIGRSDHLWVGFCEDRKVVKLDRANVFYRNNENTRTDYIPDGSGRFRPVQSDRDELILARFDGQASMATKQLLQWARKHHQTGQAPFHLQQTVVAAVELRGDGHWRVTTPGGKSYTVTTDRAAHDYAAGTVEFFGPGSPAFPDTSNNQMSGADGSTSLSRSISAILNATASDYVVGR